MGPNNPWSPDWRPDTTGRRLATIRLMRWGALIAAILYLLVGVGAAVVEFGDRAITGIGVDLGVAAGTVAAAAAIAGTTWLVRPAGETPAPASGPVPRIVRSDVDTPAVMEALLGTTLSADANGCVQAGSDPTAVTLVWPRGYTVHGNAQSFEILDQANNVVARSGVPLDIGGGGVDHFQPTWTGKDCATATRFWWVGHISQR